MKKITIRVPEETLEYYKIWLKKRGYSINQHLNKVIARIAKMEESDGKESNKNNNN